MPPPSCSRCSAPLSMEAAQGQARCASCGTVNAPLVNPYGPQMVPQAPMFGGAAGAPPWQCFSCRHQNEGRYEFCLGCGAAQRGGGGAEGGEGDRGGANRSSPVIAIVVASLVVVAIAGGAVAFLLLGH